MNREADLRRTSSSSHIGTAEMSLAMWLRNGRAQKNLSLDDVARITKIQTRTLERLEAGRLDGLPAEVFVRGFVRSFARCVGLDEDEALRRYTACLKDGGSKAPVAAARALSMIDAMGELAPNARARAPQAPQILHAEPGFAAGSMEIPADEIVVQTEATADVSVEAEAALAPSEPTSSVMSDPTENPEPREPSDAIVVAPPADIDLSAEISIPVGEIAPAKGKKRTRRATTTVTAEGAPKRRRKVATGTPSEPTPVIAETSASTEAPKRRRKPRGSVQPPVETIEAIETVETIETSAAIEVAAAPIAGDAVVAEEIAVEVSTMSTMSAFEVGHAEGELELASEAPEPKLEASSIEVVAADPAPEAETSTSRFERVDNDEEAPVQLPTEAWTPRMPPFAIAAPPSWRKSPAQPALVAVIDDADPDGAERMLEDRRAGERRRTFLPPILLDRDGDRSARQGGLTLAVIILLIAATLTLSYLMRRPSSSGDGVTLDDTAEVPTHVG